MPFPFSAFSDWSKVAAIDMNVLQTNSRILNYAKKEINDIASTNAVSLGAFVLMSSPNEVQGLLEVWQE